jgi:hypothetical protein
MYLLDFELLCVYIGSMAKTEHGQGINQDETSVDHQELKIGVWEENGVIHRRDSSKEPFTRDFTPINPEDTQKVLDLTERLHNISQMPEWVPEIEAEQVELQEELKILIK